MKVQLIKIKDNRFNGNHPNNINVGSTKIIDDVLQKSEIKRPAIGESYLFQNRITSPVIAVTEKNGNVEFETENSTYLLKFGND